MNSIERRATGALAAIYAFRMLGLFMLLPVLAVAASGYDHATPALIGAALGAYGLTQALLQIPFGLLSDRLGRKPIISLGLLLFIAGSLLAAAHTDVRWLIAGRALQGAGAVAATVMALLADLTSDEQRTKAMALIGISIGGSYMLAMVLGPLITGWVGLRGLLLLIACLGAFSLVLLWQAVPSPVAARRQRDALPASGQLLQALRRRETWRLHLSVFVLHATMTALFLVVPHLLLRTLGLEPARHWLLYLPILLCSVALMVPLLILAERGGRPRMVFAAAILAIAAAQLLLWRGGGVPLALLAALTLFFTAFNSLEALLPSLVSRAAPLAGRGATLGVFSTAQFLGAFAGGVGGGLLQERYGASGLLVAGAGLALVWLLPVLSLRAPPRLLTRSIDLGNIDPDRAAALGDALVRLPGVAEAQVLADERVVYLRVEGDRYDPEQVRRSLAAVS